MNYLKRFTTGFTLAELLISVSIIALITAATSAGYANVLRRSRDAKRMADMEAIHTALDSFYADHNRYPGPTDGISPCGQYIGVKDLGSTAVCGTVPAGRVSIDTILEPYMGNVPHDPLQDVSVENSSADGITAEYYYFYDSYHNILFVPGTPLGATCTGSPPNGVVFGFFKSELNNPNLNRDTCMGGDMSINRSHFNVGLFPESN